MEKFSCFSLLMKEIAQTGFLGGEDNKGGKFFRHDLLKLANGWYEMAGKMVAFSILHGGSGIPVLHEATYNMITNGDCLSTDIGIEECIHDVEVRQKLQSVRKLLYVHYCITHTHTHAVTGR